MILYTDQHTRGLNVLGQLAPDWADKKNLINGTTLGKKF